jgi:excisionase family DNA binding protein
MSKKHKNFGRGSLSRRAPDGSKVFLTVEEAAVFFNVGKATVLEWIKQGVVPQYNISGRVYFNKEEVGAYWAMFK